MNLFRSKNGNSTNHKFTQRALLLIPLALACLALLPQAMAVVPPPDGGYAGYNTAEGQNALFNLTSLGVANTAVGWSSLLSATSGSFNTATGAGALLFNNANQNTAFGAAALLLNTDGDGNTAVGASALLNNAGGGNTAVGRFALRDNTAGGNTAVGNMALVSNTTGTFNTALGSLAGINATTGSNNIALGQGAGFNLTTGDNNIDIGNEGVAGESDTIRIGTAQTATFIAGIRGATTGNMGALPVLIDSAGQLGTMSSSARFKKDIKPMDKSSEAILALKPVTFHYKQGDGGQLEFGLIAEEVAKVNPDLTVHDKEGQIYSVRYDAVNAMLLNEFLKEHRKNEEQEATIARQQKQIEALTARLEKVSVQLEVNRPAPQLAESN